MKIAIPKRPSLVGLVACALLLAVAACGAGQPQVPVPSPASASATSAPSATAAPDYVRIRNRAHNTYLYEASSQVRYGTPEASDTSAHWLIEDFEGSQRIKNRATGHYMTIEHLTGAVESIAVEDSWPSARWTVVDAPAAGYRIIRNVWHTWDMIHIKGQRGHAQYGSMAITDLNAQWVIESPDAPPPTPTGTPLPTNTPGPTSTPLPPGSRGATVPWIEYEAEQASTNGEILGPSRAFGEIASESTGRQSVRLAAPGAYVEFSAAQEANALVVRYVIPDAPAGGGISATLSLYVDGSFRQKLNLTSKYAWSYGGEASADNNPALGGAHHFFDEARALVGSIPAGAAVRLQRDSDDTADYYVIDLVDLEQVAPPTTMPESFLSITECGATPDDGTEDGQAIQECINQAKSQGRGVWIPPGTFESSLQLQSNMGIAISEVTLRGAGMWYSTIHGSFARFHCTGNNCGFFDFAILGETTTRDDDTPENGFNGGAGSGSRMEGVWVEHTKVGWWVGAGSQNVTNGLVISGSRFRNLFADGVNFCNGTSNSVVEHSHFRNTGDDALASWSPSFDGPVNVANTFRFNTVQVPWRANCFAIYGGRDHTVEDNLCYDVITYPGILIAQQFNSHPFGGLITVQRSSLIRAGGSMWNQEHGALKIHTAEGTLAELVVRDLVIESPTFSGIQIQGPSALSNASLSTIQISNPGSYGILINSSSNGAASVSGVTVAGAGSGGLRDDTNGRFVITRGADNRGW